MNVRVSRSQPDGPLFPYAYTREDLMPGRDGVFDQWLLTRIDANEAHALLDGGAKLYEFDGKTGQWRPVERAP